MLHTLKENLFVILATLFFTATLAFSFTAYGQTSGDCEACGGDPDDGGTCYAVDAGATLCRPTMFGCTQSGSCENGYPVLELEEV
ncbi:hypothetical protein [Fodinibius halophilus]|uniref:Uncharacterized protein n=1 Tax=Fodinibius halophilus TaxID=1736908 RepID=A0A6M1TFA2_9BACT|nr:hypothetical protein [Fodinibius halophilus]NGP87290.1 hypothetical protein [Fodinibius halophilus]